MVDILPTVAGLVNIPYRNNALGRDLLAQQRRAGGRDNAAFIIDRHDHWIGVVKQQHFARHRLDATRPELVWADFTAPVPATMTAPSEDYQKIANAFYETSRYLLLNNKKSAAGK